MTAKAVCKTHDRAYEVGSSCPWCEPDKGAPPPGFAALEHFYPSPGASSPLPPPMRVWTYPSSPGCGCATCALAWAGLDDDE